MSDPYSVMAEFAQAGGEGRSFTLRLTSDGHSHTGTVSCRTCGHRWAATPTENDRWLILGVPVVAIEHVCPGPCPHANARLDPPWDDEPPMMFCPDCEQSWLDREQG